MIQVYLASRSPRRRVLLEQINICHEVIDVRIDESWDGKETAKDYVTRLALEKARAGSAIRQKDYPVLAADTEVVIDAEILGKPAGRDAAITMLQKLSGRTHQVYSAIALIDKKETVRLQISQVSFKPLTQEECAAYCDTQEPFGKAGAYAIQGKAAAFISNLEGSYSGVMGLPLFETAELLQQSRKP